MATMQSGVVTGQAPIALGVEDYVRTFINSKKSKI